MTTSEQRGTDDASQPRSKERVLSLCRGCGNAIPAIRGADGDLQPVGTRCCPECEGTNFRELMDRG